MFSHGSYINYTSLIVTAGVSLFISFMILIVTTAFLLKTIKGYPYKSK
ncbi:Uncharacterised protein [Streptococcus pneumoniae]|uniref:Uncharacterized protein n=1 Tax=Periweissella fabaria TaxID=546157 RepID=A0ABM8Z8P9_9LACO|nr:hypothetical protein WFA24289_01888 [Periweissella fabaria]COJ70691.1 Uncharacterised protein [Streptococcus pneumoniae]